MRKELGAASGSEQFGGKDFLAVEGNNISKVSLYNEGKPLTQPEVWIEKKLRSG